MKIVISRNDGGISIIHPGDDGDADISHEDAAALVENWQETSPDQQILQWGIFENIDIPADRSNRDKWKISQGKIIVSD